MSVFEVHRLIALAKTEDVIPIFCIFEGLNITDITMENITIPVPPFIAQAYAKADVAVKRKAEIYINAWLDSFFSSSTGNSRLQELMNKGADEAEANGLTPEKLEDLLHNDD